MSMYTTGEIAKICGVTVRTVQYYDTRGILVPSDLTEGGRRLYTEEDLVRLKVICLLRHLGLSIHHIDELFQEDNFDHVMETILQQQELELKKEIFNSQEQLKKVTQLKQSLKNMKDITIESIGDIAQVMENKKKLNQIRGKMLAFAIPFCILEWTAIILGLMYDIWWVFVVYTLLGIPFVYFFFQYYWKNISCVCPECHKVFKPSRKEMFFAKHTFTTRKLTCTCCGHKGYCVETCEKDAS